MRPLTSGRNPSQAGRGTAPPIMTNQPNIAISSPSASVQKVQYQIFFSSFLLSTYRCMAFEDGFRLHRTGTLSHKGFKTTPDPYAGRQRTGASFLSAILATALFRCWHLLIFFAAWALLVSVLNEQGHKVQFASTLLTVVGTVLGFVISYRTTSAFERYTEGRRLWSQIVLASRTFARTVWFHIPDPPATATETAEQLKAKAMIEKKTAINLVEAFSHYLRGEDGIYYRDLYYLVKFLPAYTLPTGIPSNADLIDDATVSPPGSPISATSHRHQRQPSDASRAQSFLAQRVNATSFSDSHLPLPATSHPPIKPTFREPPRPQRSAEKIVSDAKSTMSDADPSERVILHKADESFLFPAKMPPKYHLFDLFPFSLLVRILTKRGKELKGKKAAKLRAKMRNKAVSHNLPLEISLYLSSYIAALQVRKVNEVPTTNTLLAALNQLVDSLTGLERILTTPIPFSYVSTLFVISHLCALFLLLFPNLSLFDPSFTSRAIGDPRVRVCSQSELFHHSSPQVPRR
ncbi:hypothetical protein D9757_003062 [Collybiopsis confluens]|uniref:Uncharacterized protein n=1 Tax=Collybiopsis confluens TaxID=2823264 RepID=A0A8H5MEL2_9AGAR|nr:hypothetical protein D9757_003062 [Collybiopsis confluens]